MRVWVWVGLLWSDRVRLALEHYGDRITDVSIFGWHVAADGTVTEDFDPDLLLPYRDRWPHLRFWLAFRNDGSSSIVHALLDSAAARARMIDGLEAALDERPWLSGIDIDLESVGGVEYAAGMEGLFQEVADLAHGRGLECSAALPPLTASGSVGGQGWARYGQIGRILDHVSIMSYDFAWSGSAPGPISPGFWMEDVYDWAVSQMRPEQVRMGLPLYSYWWKIHQYPAELGEVYRGNSGSYYVAAQVLSGFRAWGGSDANPDGPGTHHHIGWLAFRDADSMSAWAFLDVYDWRYSPDWEPGSNSGVSGATWEGRPYLVRYGRPSGEPLWSVADNSAPLSGAAYSMTPRSVVATDGARVSPKVGFTVTVELLKRPPVAATIIDDNASTQGQLADIYSQPSGSWERWSEGSYSQYRGQGELRFRHDFSGDAVYLQIRGQFGGSGRVGVTARGVTADVDPSGALRIVVGGAVVATAQVAARPVGAEAGTGRFVLGLRVREGSARAYFSTTEEGELPKVAQAAVSPSGGDVGITAAAPLWVDHVYLGDGWWYQPREAVEVQIGSESKLLGRFERSGVTWDDANRFRPDADVDERETRESATSLDWVYDHWRDVPLVADRSSLVRIRSVDHDVWLGKIIVCDRDGATLGYWSDAETIVHWRDRAALDWGLGGVALWSLGQEDMRLWDRLAGGELPPDTKRVLS